MASDTTTTPPFRGIPVKLAGLLYVLPALSFGGIMQCKDAIQKVTDGTLEPSELQAAFADVLLAALQRNYPDMQREFLMDALDWPTALDMYVQLMKVSFPLAQPGETTVVSPSGASTGN